MPVCVWGLRGVLPRPRGAVPVSLRCRCLPGGGCPYRGVFVCCAVSLVCSRTCAPTPVGGAGFPSRFSGPGCALETQPASEGRLVDSLCLQCAHSELLSFSAVWRLVLVVTRGGLAF